MLRNEGSARLLEVSMEELDAVWQGIRMFRHGGGDVGR